MVLHSWGMGAKRSTTTAEQRAPATMRKFRELRFLNKAGAKTHAHPPPPESARACLALCQAKQWVARNTCSMGKALM